MGCISQLTCCLCLILSSPSGTLELPFCQIFSLGVSWTLPALPASFRSISSHCISVHRSFPQLCLICSNWALTEFFTGLVCFSVYSFFLLICSIIFIVSNSLPKLSHVVYFATGIVNPVVLQSVSLTSILKSLPVCFCSRSFLLVLAHSVLSLHMPRDFLLFAVHWNQTRHLVLRSGMIFSFPDPSFYFPE